MSGGVSSGVSIGGVSGNRCDRGAGGGYGSYGYPCSHGFECDGVRKDLRWEAKVG